MVMMSIELQAGMPALPDIGHCRIKMRITTETQRAQRSTERKKEVGHRVFLFLVFSEFSAPLR
jgi:hypothetical protein